MKKIIFFLSFITLFIFCFSLRAQDILPGNTSQGFIEEKGQIKTFDNLRFYLHHNNVYAYFLPDRIVFITQEIRHEDNKNSLEATAKGDDNLAKKLSAVTLASRFDLVFVNSDPDVKVTGENSNSFKLDYYLAHCPEGILNVPSYNRIRYNNLYPNVDLVFSLDGEMLKYEFVVKTGGDPSQIHLRWDGVKELQLNKKDEIQFSVGSFIFSDKTPVSFCGENKIATKYIINGNNIKFDVAQYNANETLIIDPALYWASSLEYNGYGTWGALVTNSTGQFYNVDWEWSPGGTDMTNYFNSAGTSTLYSLDASNNDIIISKFSKTGALLWVCRYGGTGDDDVNGGVALDDSDNLFITGTTQKEFSHPSGDFPLQTWTGAFNLAWNGTCTSTRGYLIKFLANNTRQWATYIDNGANMEVFDIASGLNNDMYLAGKSGSSLTCTGITIPSGTGYLGNFTSNSASHNFILRFNSSGALTWSTWLPGATNSTGRVSDITINKSNGDVYLAGDEIWGATYNFASALISASLSYQGQSDLFYLKFNSSNQAQPAYGKYIGGAGFDKINIGAANGDIEQDASGNLYVCGHTYSANFPLVNPGTCTYYDGIINDGTGITANVASTQDGYLFKVNTSGTLAYSTFFGGTGYTSMKQLKKDSHNNLWICGHQTAAGLTTLTHSDYYNHTITGTSNNIMFAQLGTYDNMEWLSYYGFTGHSEYNGFDIWEPTTDSAYLYLSGNFSGYVNTGGGYQYVNASTCSGAAEFRHKLSSAPFTVSGSTTLCAGFTTTWTSTSSGGSWSSSNTGVATINPSTGLVTGVSGGTAIITYSLTINSCVFTASATVTVTANTTPTFTALGSYCVGATPGVFSGTSTNGITGTWTPATISTATPGTTIYTFTPTTGLCATSTSMSVTVNANVAPTFTALGPYCVGATPGALSGTSTNGITGTWTPATISTAAPGTTIYTFTPTAGLCATTTTMSVTVNANVAPTFTALGPYCVGATPGSLSGTSTNGITGTWNPATITTAAPGTTIYTFTPTTGLCATTTTMSVTVNANVAPTFTALGPYCVGATPGALSGTSTNGITGTWNPATISTAAPGTTIYTFTPTAGLCATTNTMSVTVNANVAPTFTALGPYCVGATPGALSGTSTNGITGTWSPSTITTASAGSTTYTFTPTAGLCATTSTMPVTVNANVSPTFTVLGPYCVGATPGILSGTSTNGITGTWNPATISTSSAGSTTYTFTPTAGLCATSTTMPITVNSNVTPTFTALGPYCVGDTPGILSGTSNNGITGTWNPATISTAFAGNTTYTYTPTAGLCTSTTSMQVTVNSVLPVDIYITANPSGPVCSGTLVTFIANAANPGTLAVYQWTLNGNIVGGNNTTYTNTSLLMGDKIVCQIASSLDCVSNNPAVSDTITMVVKPSLIASISVSTLSNPGCTHSVIDFTAIPVNGGTTPVYEWHLNGNPVGGNSSTYSNNNLINGDVINCTLISNEACVVNNPTNSNNVIMIIIPVPVAEAGSNGTYSGTPVQIGDAANGPGIISWLPATGLDNATIAQPLASPVTTTVYTLSVNNNGCVATDAVTVYVNGHIISGKTRYLGKANAGSPAPNMPTYNPVIYDIDKVIVILKTQPGGVELARDTTDALGVYMFNNVADGSYMLSYDKYTADTMQWGDNVNAIDVALLKYLVGSDTLTDPSRSFSAKYKKAANVDNNTSINAVDIARVKAKIGSPYDAAKNFPRGNWVAIDTNISMMGSDMNITLKTICYGDYNASSSKYRDSVNTWGSLKMLQENIIVKSDESLVTSNTSLVEIPLRISAKVNDFSALGLELNYPHSEYKLVSAYMPGINSKGSSVKINPTLDEIITDDNDLLVTDHDGIIRVVYATTKHFDVAANDAILTLGFKSLKEIQPGLLDFDLAGTGVIGDQYGTERPDAYLLMPRMYIQGNAGNAEFEFSGYPNPFTSEATIYYNLPENGAVSLKVYNAIGELVSDINETQSRGKHTVEFSERSLPAGMYTFKLEFTGKDKSKCLILKLIH